MARNNKALKYVSLISLLFLLLVVLTACSEKEIEGYSSGDDGRYHNDNPKAVAIILGNHANAMAIPNDVFEHIANQLDRVVYGSWVLLRNALTSLQQNETIKETNRRRKEELKH